MVVQNLENLEKSKKFTENAQNDFYIYSLLETIIFQIKTSITLI